MRIFNSLTNQSEDLKLITKDQVNIYSCGPTVYDDVHIGNLASFIYSDTLARVLGNNYAVKHVMNITDVDDKTINRSQQLYPDLSAMQALGKLTKVYEHKFYDDLKRLNIDISKYTFIRATESIDIMQKLIIKLLKSGYAYVSDDGIYFSIEKYRNSGKTYGKLIHLDFKENDSSKSRINNDEYDKQTIHDFVLWKFVKDGEPSWDFIVEDKNHAGRPGWHIECSAMSTSQLGQPFDLHTGGVDLKFPHHENEIAQSTTDPESVYLAKVFFHNEHLLVNNQKMSKSLNNFYTLDDIVIKVSDPIAFRVLILQSNYKNRSDFSYENLISAERRLVAYKNFSILRYQLDNNNSSPIMNFDDISETVLTAVYDDLNTPKALADLSVFINMIGNNRINLAQEQDLIKLITLLDDLFGMGLGTVPDISPEQIKLIDQRNQARSDRNWSKSDQLRERLIDQGIVLLDRENYQIWQYL
jgi:cysteinyl-tRNA synthetase